MLPEPLDRPQSSDEQRAERARRQRNLRRAQDVGLALLALGVLLLAYAAIVANGY